MLQPRKLHSALESRMQLTLQVLCPTLGRATLIDPGCMCALSLIRVSAGAPWCGLQHTGDFFLPGFTELGTPATHHPKQRAAIQPQCSIGLRAGGESTGLLHNPTVILLLLG